MAISSEEALEGMNCDKLVDSGEVGNMKDLAPRAEHEDIEMSECHGGNVKEAGEGNVLATKVLSKDTEDVGMDGGEATEQSENLLKNSHTLLSENDVTSSAHKEAVEAGGGGGKEEEELGVEEHDEESQEDDEGVEEGEEGTLQKTGDNVLKDATNTEPEEGSNTAAEKLFWFPQGTIKRVMKLDPEVNLVNSEAVFLVNKAVEQFVQCLALEASNFMGGRKTLVGRDISSAIESQDCLAFLEGAMED